MKKPTTNKSLFGEFRGLIALAVLSINQLTVNIGEASAQSWQWAKQMGGNIAGLNTEDSRDEVLGMQVDKRGNSYILFRTCTDRLNPNKIQIDGTDINRNFGYRDFVLASLDCSGKLRWAKSFGGPGNTDRALDLKIDTLGGVYLLGYLDIDNDSANIDLDTLLKPSVGLTEYRRLVLIKYDSSGNYKWLRMPEPDTLGGYNRNSVSYTMDVSPTGKISLLTVLRTRGAFASGAYIVPSSTTLPALHMLQYDANGNFTKGFPVSITGSSLTIMSYLRMAWDWKNDVYYIGAIKYIGEPALSFGSTAQTGSNLLAKLSNTGSLLWAKQATGSATPNIPLQPIVDAMGNVYCAASDISGNSFLGHTFKDSFYSAGGNWALIKVTNSGSLMWSVNLNCEVAVGGSGAALGKNDEVSFYGGAIGGAKFGPFSMIGSGTSKAVVQLVLDANNGKIKSFDTVRGNNLCNFNAACADAHGNFYSAYSYDVNLKVGATTLGKYGGLTDIGFVKFGEASCDPIPTSIIEGSVISNVKIYPNPANDFLYIDGLQSSTELSLYNIVGQEVKQLSTQKNKEQISIGDLPSGMYLILIKDKAGNVYSTKVVKE